MASFSRSRQTLPVQQAIDGIVTFLFSDVEGSTRLVREFGDERWADLLETHRQLLRAALGAHAGREVGTQGDAIFAVFAEARNRGRALDLESALTVVAGLLT
jgi:class 3 adenylate cyclase